MAEILATLHPDNNPNDDLYPNVKKENIPSKAINLSKLSPEVQNKIPKVINTDEVLPATKLKYLEIDGITYSIPQRVDVTSNIKITGNINDVLASPKNLLCILSGVSSLAIKVVDKIEGGSEEISTLNTVLPQGIQYACCASHGDDIYIFGGYNGSNPLNTIYKFNTYTKTIETLNVTLPQALYGACCATYEDNIYIFGGSYVGALQNKIYKLNCTNETISTLSVTLPQASSGICCSIYEDNIYLFGGNTTKNIYKFNCTNETIVTLSTTLPQSIYWSCCSTYNNNIYIFGGFNTSNNILNTIYKFNCTNETIVTLSTTLPQEIQDACCSIYFSDIYIFGGKNSITPLNTIYKFNCINETISALSITLPQLLHRACCSIYESNIYIFGGYNNGYLQTIYSFATSFELAANNVLIYNANSNYSFELVTNQVTIPINKVYIGDSTNTAQLANAYLYDETKTGWVNVNTGEVLS